MIKMLKKTELSVLVLVLLLSQATQADQRCQTEHIAATTPTTRYQQNDDGTIIDKETGLMWRRCVEGISGDACDNGEPLALNWAEALLYVPQFNNKGGFAGYKDWRLPNIRELNTLTELQCVNPAINLVVFPNTASLPAWSASPSRFVTHYSWYVDFRTGVFNHDVREKVKSIRLVRDGEGR